MKAPQDNYYMKLDCGRWVQIHALEYKYTYRGLVLGNPNAKLNARIVEDAGSPANHSWGSVKIHLIPPTIDHSYPKFPLLPPMSLRAWLTCDVPINHGFEGSQLVVVWFADECYAETIFDVVFRAVRGLPWEELAQDYNIS